MYRRSAFYPKPKKSSAGGLILLFGMLLLLLVVAVIAFLIWRRTAKKEAKNLYDLTQQFEKQRANIYKAGEDLGIDPADLKYELLESSNLVCYVYPENGVCDANFYDLKNGCCELRSNASELAAQARKEMALEMTTMVMVSFLPEVFLTTILPKLLKSPRLAIILNRLRGMGTKAFSKIMAKSIARTAIKAAVSMAAKAAILATKVLLKLSSGPVGWALAVLDVFSYIFDAANNSNYNSFLANRGNLEIRDAIIYQFALAIANDKSEYPMLFPFGLLFPEESETAISEYQTYLMSTHAKEIFTTIPGAAEWYAGIWIAELEAAEGGQEGPPLNQEEDEKALDFMELLYEKVREKYGRDLDKFLFDTLQSLIPDTRKSDVVLIPSMSTAKTIGISISEEAAKRWNAAQREEWFMYLDAFFPPNRPNKDWVPPFVASYTDTYLMPNPKNPGTSNAPNIITKTLPTKVTLAYPFGSLVTFCEKPRSSTKFNKPVDPTKYGVSLDTVTGVCNFTKDYCQRYGIDFKTRTWKDGTPFNDCEESDVQKGSSWVVGDTIVKDTKLWFEDPAQARENKREQAAYMKDKRKEEHGTDVANILTAVDPDGTFENWGRGLDEQLAGRDKYCDPADTCKEFHVKHGGGNFMGWSARDANGDIYSNGQGFQNQVKSGEDHTFFVPEGGYFRVKCDPGESMNVPYEDIENPLRFSCWAGKIRRNPGKDSIWISIGDFAKEDAGPALAATLETVGENYKDTADAAIDTYVANVEEACGSDGNAGECIGAAVGGVVPVLGSFVAVVLNPYTPPPSSTSGSAQASSWGINFPSDRRLKKDIKRTKLESPIPGLAIYTWNWNEIAMSTYGLKGSEFGFVTDEIADEYISKDVYGYEHIKNNSPVHKALLKLKSKYSVKK